MARRTRGQREVMRTIAARVLMRELANDHKTWRCVGGGGGRKAMENSCCEYARVSQNHS